MDIKVVNLKSWWLSSFPFYEIKSIVIVFLVAIHFWTISISWKPKLYNKILFLMGQNIRPKLSDKPIGMLMSRK